MNLQVDAIRRAKPIRVDPMEVVFRVPSSSSRGLADLSQLGTSEPVKCFGIS
jgi:hypothetical protein